MFGLWFCGCCVGERDAVAFFLVQSYVFYQIDVSPVLTVIKADVKQMCVERERELQREREVWLIGIQAKQFY